MRPLAVAGLAVLVGCSYPSPGPPTPPPEPWTCPLEMPECSTVNQTCSSPESPCWHNPTSDPEHCEEAPACPAPPGPPSECMLESALVAVPGCSEKLSAVVRAGALAVGDDASREPQETLRLVAAKITEQTGRCAIGGQEALFVDRWDGLVEENHLVHFGTHLFNNGGAGKFMGCHMHTKCPAPDPTTLDGAFVIHCGLGNGSLCDSTYKVWDRAYCEAVGFPGRQSCPVRPDGNFARQACEDYVIGDQRWFCNGVEIGHESNPAKAHCTGHVKTCTQDLRVCSEMDTP